jgi:two-component system, cell cycle sensor histidine kinase and response regulator CckA
MQAQKTILIVEDERVVARDIQRTLIDLGYDVPATAATAEQALQLASEHCPSLVLMDVQIKGDRDGITTAELLRERFDVPVVYLTAFGDTATVERAKLTEPYGYLLKPVKARELRSVVEVALYKHQMDRRLRQRERWFSATLASIADAVVAVDIGGSVTFMNRAAEELTGTALKDAVGRPAHQVLRLIDGEANALTETPVLQALREERSIFLEQADLVNAASGATRTINDSAAPVIDDGTVLGAVMVFRDVSERKRLNQQLELADRLASLGTLASGVAHEVNNPLSVIIANAEIVLEEIGEAQASTAPGGDPERGRHVAAAIQAQRELQSAASRIARIVADLGAFSRPKPELPGPLDVRDPIEWAIRSTAHVLDERARLTTHLEKVPRVAANDTRLGQVLVNLLINAAHSIAPGAPTANEVTVTTRMGEPDQVVIEVRDTGSGISREDLARIFEPFFTTKPAGVGTGLGLSICHGIVSSLNGRLEVESEVGRGSVFRVILPASKAPPSEVPPEPRVEDGPHAEHGRLMIVDDDEMVLRSLARILGHHEVVCLSSAKEALAMLERDSRFDLILCDLMMPGMTGIEFYEALLEKRPEAASRMIFLTGGVTTARGADFLATVTNHRVQKPFDVRQLRVTVQELLAARAFHGRSLALA